MRNTKLRRRATYAVSALVVVAVAAWFLRPLPAPESAAPVPATRTLLRPLIPAEPLTPSALQLRPLAPAASLPRSPLADSLHSPATTARDDLATLKRILYLYRERFGAYPAFGDNPQLINALAGANPARLGLIPRDHPALDSATGALRDRWGTPYVFHALSRDSLDLRTAGPDRQPYTPDDLTLHLGPPPPPSPLTQKP